MNLFCEIHRSSDVIYVALEGGTFDGVDYRGDIIEDIEVSKSIPDVFYGVERTESITIRLANVDNGVDPTWDEIAAEEDLRTCWVVLKRDSKHIATGNITNYTLGIEASITIEPRDDEIFETLFPKGIVTTDVFTDTAINIGEAIPINFGYCRNVPCPNIQNNTADDHYDYLVGYGVVEGLWIDHTNGMGVKWEDGSLASSTLYTFYDGSQASPFAGYAFIRFTGEQRGFSNEFLTIYADVKGLELGGSIANRNFSDIIKAIASNSTWGLEESVNLSSFATAASSLSTDAWMCDVSLHRQTKVRDSIDDILFACHSWLSKNDSDEWELTVDGIGSSVASFGENDGYYNNCDVLSYGVTPSNSTIKTAYLNYDNGEKQISIAVNSTFGVDKTFETECISEDVTAKKLLSYIYGRSIYADKKISILCGTDATDVDCGNVIGLSILDRSITDTTYRVIGTTKKTIQTTLNCEAYDSRIFDSQTIATPTAQSSSAYVGLHEFTGTGSLTTNISITNLTGNGIKTSLQVGEGFVFGEVGYVKSDGKIWKASGIDDAKMPGRYMSLATIGADDSGLFLWRGFVKNNAWSWTKGSILKLGTEGAIAQQSTGQIVGIAITETEIDFNPQFMFMPDTARYIAVPELTVSISSLASSSASAVYATPMSDTIEVSVQAFASVGTPSLVVYNKLSPVTLTIASPCVATYASHGLSEEHEIFFSTLGTLPTGIVEDTHYFVKDKTDNTFNVSATAGGAAINTSGSQGGTHSLFYKAP